MRDDRREARRAGRLVVGAGRVAVVPPKGLPLAGFPHERPNTGVGMPLHARAFVLGVTESDDAATAQGATQATPRAAIIVIDTMAVYPPMVARIREGLARGVAGLDPENILVAATHTHSAPSLTRLELRGMVWPSSPEYVEQVVRGAIQAGVQAWDNRKAVTVRLGYDEARLGHNRRVVDEQGNAANQWRDEEGKTIGFFNPAVRFVVFEDTASGKPHALLSLYACHPVALGPGNTLSHPDYPGFFVQAIEAALPGCQALHLTGAAGDINPREGTAPEPVFAERIGQTLARLVLRQLPYARPIDPLPLAMFREEVGVPVRQSDEPHYTFRSNDAVDGKVPTEVQVLRLGELAMVTVPGELFGELGLAMSNTSPFETTLVVGYSNDNIGYLPTAAAIREGAYEVQGLISLHAEQTLMPAARQLLYRAKRGQ